MERYALRDAISLVKGQFRESESEVLQITTEDKGLANIATKQTEGARL